MSSQVSAGTLPADVLTAIKSAGQACAAAEEARLMALYAIETATRGSTEDGARDRLISLDELAKRLNVAPVTIRRAGIEGVPVGDRVRYDFDDARRQFEERGKRPTTPKTKAATEDAIDIERAARSAGLRAVS